MSRSNFDVDVANDWDLTTSYVKHSGVVRAGPLAPQPASGTEAYGFGWSELHFGGVRLLSHSGDIGAAGPFGSSGLVFTLSPDRRVAVGVLSNMSSLEKGRDRTGHASYSVWRRATCAAGPAGLEQIDIHAQPRGVGIVFG
jgi:hypothetical protein